MHLISQLLQIRSAWWLASMFPLWMQIKLAHTVLKPCFKSGTFLHRTGQTVLCPCYAALWCQYTSTAWERGECIILPRVRFKWRCVLLESNFSSSQNFPSLLPWSGVCWDPPCIACSLPPMSLLQGCSHLWQGQGVTKGFSSISWCSCAAPFLQSHGASSGNAAQSSAGTKPRWMETDNHFCKQ